MRVSFSFDNGPTPGVTESVLDVLARYEIAASFFVIGRKLESGEARRLVARARAEGHRVGNHTYSHSVPLGRLDDLEAIREIDATQALLGDLAPERLFRPYGEGKIGPHLLSRAALAHLVAGRFTCVLWNAVPGDWKNPQGWVDDAIDLCTTQDFSLVVLHDLPTGAMDLLPQFLDRVSEIGAQFTQDYPADCVPIFEGKALSSISRMVSSE